MMQACPCERSLRKADARAPPQAFGSLRLHPLMPEPPHRSLGVFVFGAGGVSEPAQMPEPPEMPEPPHRSEPPHSPSGVFVFTAPSSNTRTPAQQEADFASRVSAAEVKDQLRNAEHQEIRNKLRDTLVRSGEWVSLGNTQSAYSAGRQANATRALSAAEHSRHTQQHS
jgi:hypothetical protein